jgi:hypothetical protein
MKVFDTVNDLEDLESSELIDYSFAYYANRINLSNNYRIDSIDFEFILGVNNIGVENYSISVSMDLLKIECHKQKLHSKENKSVRTIEFANMTIEETIVNNKSKYEIEFKNRRNNNLYGMIYIQLSGFQKHPLEEKYGTFGLRLSKLYCRTPYNLNELGTGYLRIPITKAEFTEYVSNGNSVNMKVNGKITMSALEIIRYMLLIRNRFNSKFYDISGFRGFDIVDDMLVYNIREEKVEANNDELTIGDIKCVYDNDTSGEIDKWANKLRISGCNVEVTDSLLSKLYGNIKEITLPDILGIKEKSIQDGATLIITSKNTMISQANLKDKGHNVKIKFAKDDMDFIDSDKYIETLSNGNKTMHDIIKQYITNQLTNESDPWYSADSTEKLEV